MRSKLRGDAVETTLYPKRAASLTANWPTAAARRARRERLDTRRCSVALGTHSFHHGRRSTRHPMLLLEAPQAPDGSGGIRPEQQSKTYITIISSLFHSLRV